MTAVIISTISGRVGLKDPRALIEVGRQLERLFPGQDTVANISVAIDHTHGSGAGAVVTSLIFHDPQDAMLFKLAWVSPV